MTPSSYTSEPYLLLQRALGDVWRPGLIRNIPDLADELRGDVSRPENIPDLVDELRGDVSRPENIPDVVDELRMAQAIRWLAAKPDLKTMKRDDYKGECIDQFGISGRGYQFRVWPAARKLRGLKKRARPGPKKQVKK